MSYIQTILVCLNLIHSLVIKLQAGVNKINKEKFMRKKIEDEGSLQFQSQLPKINNNNPEDKKNGASPQFINRIKDTHDKVKLIIKVIPEFQSREIQRVENNQIITIKADSYFEYLEGDYQENIKKLSLEINDTVISSISDIFVFFSRNLLEIENRSIEIQVLQKEIYNIGLELVKFFSEKYDMVNVCRNHFLINELCSFFLLRQTEDPQLDLIIKNIFDYKWTKLGVIPILISSLAKVGEYGGQQLMIKSEKQAWFFQIMNKSARKIISEIKLLSLESKVSTLTEEGRKIVTCIYFQAIEAMLRIARGYLKSPTESTVSNSQALIKKAIEYLRFLEKSKISISIEFRVRSLKCTIDFCRTNILFSEKIELKELLTSSYFLIVDKYKNNEMKSYIFSYHDIMKQCASKKIRGPRAIILDRIDKILKSSAKHVQVKPIFSKEKNIEIKEINDSNCFDYAKVLFIDISKGYKLGEPNILNLVEILHRFRVIIYAASEADRTAQLIARTTQLQQSLADKNSSLKVISFLIDKSFEIFDSKLSEEPFKEIDYYLMLTTKSLDSKLFDYFKKLIYFSEKYSKIDIELFLKIKSIFIEKIGITIDKLFIKYKNNLSITNFRDIINWVLLYEKEHFRYYLATKNLDYFNQARNTLLNMSTILITEFSQLKSQKSNLLKFIEIIFCSFKELADAADFQELKQDAVFKSHIQVIHELLKKLSQIGQYGQSLNELSEIKQAIEEEKLQTIAIQEEVNKQKIMEEKKVINQQKINDLQSEFAQQSLSFDIFTKSSPLKTKKSKYKQGYMSGIDSRVVIAEAVSSSKIDPESIESLVSSQAESKSSIATIPVSKPLELLPLPTIVSNLERVGSLSSSESSLKSSVTEASEFGSLSLSMSRLLTAVPNSVLPFSQSKPRQNISLLGRIPLTPYRPSAPLNSAPMASLSPSKTGRLIPSSSPLRIKRRDNSIVESKSVALPSALENEVNALKNELKARNVEHQEEIFKFNQRIDQMSSQLGYERERIDMVNAIYHGLANDLYQSQMQLQQLYAQINLINASFGQGIFPGLLASQAGLFPFYLASSGYYWRPNFFVHNPLALEVVMPTLSSSPNPHSKQ